MSTNTPPRERTVHIDFLYLDLNTCTRCTASDTSLRQAIDLLRPVFGATGVQAELHNEQVATAQRAEQLRLLTSPTIRVNGHDIAAQSSETSCTECGDLCGRDDITCRTWTYRGTQQQQAPIGLIIEAILGQVYGAIAPTERADATAYGIPANLQRFFDSRSPSPATSKCC